VEATCKHSCDGARGFFDALAHMLFLGIVKSVYHYRVAWLVSKDALSPFCCQVDGQLDEIKSLHISWFMTLLCENGGLGAYVGEHMLCLSPLPKCFFQDINEYAVPPAAS
jgi:hypothetical protein